MKRLFIALPVPPTVQESLAELTGPLKRKVHDAKWVATHNVHVTLKFLGNTPENLIPDITCAARLAAAQWAPMKFWVQGVDAFASLGKPRVIFAPLRGDIGPLAALAREIDSLVADLGFEPERREFRGHLTLARARRRQPLPSLVDVADTLAAVATDAWHADEIVLNESTLTRSGPIYEVLERFAMDGAKPTL